ncbi:RHS repeat-associated core domain-containing protein [Tenacibaculum maritimum]|uniref:RHS repeat-associated core domain-containing protein n=1 Tax=Tenacibaculum maritimum TaxID=107401 RepID=UPI0038766844
MGTPTQMYDEKGEQVWERSLDLNGKVINGSNAPCPFLYQGQYYDKEIELAYNRFRYYDPDDGRYISKDPIGLEGGANFYAYVSDVNSFVDSLGLMAIPTNVSFAGGSDLFPTTGSQSNIVKIVLTGDRSSDFTRAYKASGIKAKDAGDYTWHHVHDFNSKTGESTMELVTRKAHEATFPHKGSAGQFQDHFGVKYDTYEAKMKAYEQGWRKKPRQNKKKKTSCG